MVVFCVSQNPKWYYHRQGTGYLWLGKGERALINLGGSSRSDQCTIFSIENSENISESYLKQLVAALNLCQPFANKNLHLSADPEQVFAAWMNYQSTLKKGETMVAGTDNRERTLANFIDIKLQEGPIKEVGVNGVQIDDVVRYCRDNIEMFNTKDNRKYSCRENAMAITKLDEALMWLQRRTENRISKGQEGRSIGTNEAPPSAVDEPGSGAASGDPPLANSGDAGGSGPDSEDRTLPTERVEGPVSGGEINPAQLKS